MEQLEKKVEKNEELASRLAVTERDLETAFVRIEELREEYRQGSTKGLC
jgi:hypothetical protein